MKSYLHQARVLLAQARHFRMREKCLGWSGSYSAWLLECVGNARRQAMREPEKQVTQTQGELFGDM